MKNTKKMDTEQTRKYLRECIKDGYLEYEDICSTDTRSMSKGVAEHYIEIAEANKAKQLQQQSSNNTASGSNNVSDILKQLQNALENGNQNTANTDVSALEDSVKELTDRINIMDTSSKDLSSKLNEIEDLIKNDNTVKSRMPIIKASASGDEIIDAVSKYYVPNTFSAVNSLLLSPPSFGKSHSARILGKQYDHYIEHNCSEDIDEISNLVGSSQPDTSNSGNTFTTVDGVLVEAVRKASKGESVLIMLDEILRWADTTQAFFLTFLSGFIKNNETWYRIRTKHNTASNTLEQIECSSKYLHIIAGANLGNIIPVEALWSRFEKVRFEWSIASGAKRAEAIIDMYNTSGSIDSSQLGHKFATAMDKSRKLVVNGSLQFPLDFRNLKRACQLYDNEKEIIDFLASGLKNNCCIWNSDTGDFEKDSLNEAKALIKNNLS